MSEAPDPAIRERTFLYSVRAVRLFEYICREGKSASAEILGEQFLRCATSLGAAIDEAQHCETRLEYMHKVAEAEKDARESLYWLRLMKDTEAVPAKRILPFEQDTREIVTLLKQRAQATRVRPVKRPARQ